MRRELAIEFSRATEAAALAGYKWLGRGDKNEADGAAVLAMRHVLNEINIRGEIVIGEGEIDEAPMLYIGERVGTGFGDDVDIAVDPIEGTRMTAMGQANAMTTLAVGEKGSFLKAPDMYMEKLIVGPKAKGVIDLDLSLEENIKRVAKAVNKPLSAFTVMTLAKPRHDEQIKQMQQLGGAPEGVVSAAVIRALDGDMQGRLVLRKDVKGGTEENIRMSEDEARRCKEMGVEPGQILKLEDMAKSDNVMFSATGITKGDLLDGIVCEDGMATTETLLIRGKSRTVRRIQSVHYLDRKDEQIKEIIL